MEINEKNIKLWSSIGPRATFGLSMLDLIKKYNDLMILTCDVSTSAGLDRFRKQYPDNYLDLGIAEQNLIGVAAGLASENFKVITTTFAPFQAIRCCEQIKVNLGYMKEKITIALDECLLDEEEVLQGKSYWLTLDDPFPKWH